MTTQQSTDAEMRALLQAKRTGFNRRSLSESSAEDLCRETQNSSQKNMCRSELPVNPQKCGVQPEEGKVIGAHNRQTISNVIDIIVRLIIVVIFIKLETTPAFKREIHAEELWLYKNPRRPDIVTPAELLIGVILGPFFLTCIFYIFTKDKRDFRAASWAWTLALCMNAVPTSLLKITVGRPRPDFYYRCFPDGVMVFNENSTALDSTFLDFNCTGRPSDVNEGRKSFPSGHSSFAFASFGFIAYYVGSKLHAFDARGRGQTWRFMISITPLVVAAMVAVSRTCDYHHHWQDVTIGALIGIVTGYISYRQYYPSIFARDCHRPLDRWPARKRVLYERLESDLDATGERSTEQRPLLGKEQTKWY
ncbi:phospholipid phosphatase 5 isoform X2 [Scaptodrosophila lebanonensis]|nr:phospholipid phosphatase 5 isoform X2 [Scaptodrosophila lebanonensis]